MVPLNGRRMRDPATKKWFHQKKNHPETLAHRGKKWNQVLPGPSKEMATVIEETSTVWIFENYYLAGVDLRISLRVTL